MGIRDWKTKLKLLESRKDNLRRKIACIGGSHASKLWLELDKIEREISRMRNAVQSSSARI
jgi:hypothetical protein